MSNQPTTPFHSKNLLVVEPDPLFRLLLCVALSSQFSDFHAVASFREARSLLAEHQFDTIVAEYHLPGGTGLALYEEVRRSHPFLPFALMCGGDPVNLPDPQFCFFAKPFSLHEMADVIARLEGRAWDHLFA